MSAIVPKPLKSYAAATAGNTVRDLLTIAALKIADSSACAAKCSTRLAQSRFGRPVRAVSPSSAYRSQNARRPFIRTYDRSERGSSLHRSREAAECS